jgi:hypothetical protein
MKVPSITQRQTTSSTGKPKAKEAHVQPSSKKNNEVSLPKKTPTVEQEKLNSGMNKIEFAVSIGTGLYAVLPTIDSVAAALLSCSEALRSIGHNPIECIPLSVERNSSKVQNTASYLVPFTVTYATVKALQKLNIVDKSRDPIRYATLAGIAGLSLNNTLASTP